MLWLWIPGVPFALALMLWLLSHLETYFIEPVERAERISALMRKVDTAHLEADVARMLAPSVELVTRRAARRRLASVSGQMHPAEGPRSAATASESA